MLSCVYNGKPFTTKENGYSAEDKYSLASRKLLLCPVCGTSVYFCEDGERIGHFTHYKLPDDCRESKLRAYDSSNTKIHDNLVEKFIEWIKSQFQDVQVYPDYLINKDLKTDIYFKLNNIEIAIEIQFKRISNPIFISRRELYKEAKVKDIWFFAFEGEYSIGSPFMRTYYRQNKHEIYICNVDNMNCSIYKGFHKEKWELVGKDTLYDAIVVNCELEQISISKGSRLFIPSLKIKYLEKLKEKKINLQKIREAKNKSILKQPESNLGGFNREKQFQITMDKPYNGECKQYHFVTENKNEYLNIIIIYQSKEFEVDYLILHKQIEGKDIYLTCRKEKDAKNVQYSIFLNSLNKVRIQRYTL